MLIGVPLETAAGEKRVATVPEVVEKLIKLGFQVAVQSGAGDAANCSDDAYRAAGAEVLPDAATLWGRADIVFKVRPPSPDEVALMREGGMLVGFVWPAQNPALMEQLAARKATVLAIDALHAPAQRAGRVRRVALHVAVLRAQVQRHAAAGSHAGGRRLQFHLADAVTPLAEALGLPAYEALNWQGLFAPAGTPGQVVKRLADETIKVLNAADVKARLAELGFDPVGNTPAEFSALVLAEQRKWIRLIQAAGIKPE
jgi:hypothetical protein